MADELQKIGWDTTRALCEAGNVQREPVFNNGLDEIIVLDTDDVTQIHFPSEERLFTGSAGSLPANGVITSGAELVGVLDNAWSNITGDTDLQTCLDSIDAAITSASASGDLDIAGDSGSGSVTLASQTLTIAGTASEIETSAASQTVTIGLPNDVTVSNDLTINNDLKFYHSGTGYNSIITWDGTNLEFDADSTFNIEIDCREFKVVDGATVYFEVDTNAGDIILGGDLTHTGASVPIAKNTAVTGYITTTNGLRVGGGSYTEIKIPASSAAAFNVNDATDNWIDINTSSPNINFGNTNDDPTFQFLGDGLVSIGGALTIGDNLTVTGGTVLLEVDDNTASALKIRDYTDNYNFIDIHTTTGSTKIDFGNTDDDPDYNFLGTGTVTVNGGLDTVNDCRARQCIADGDNAGIASTTSLTNATAAADTNSPTFINTPTGVAAAQAVWIKVYVGTTATYIPGWQ